MSFNGFCPICNTQIPNERYETGTAICECGWSDPAPANDANKEVETRAIKVMAGLAVCAALVFTYFVNYGSHALTMPVLKLQSLTGTINKQGYAEMAQACIELNKWDCARDAYIGMQQITKDGEGLVLLARLQVRLNQPEAAATTLATYFRLGGRDGDAALQYAALLEASGDEASAMKYYEASIELRPKVLPIQATTAIVRLLMKQGKFEEAQARIVAFHESADNAKGYLNTELAQAESALGQTKAKEAGSRPGTKKAKRFARA